MSMALIYYLIGIIDGIDRSLEAVGIIGLVTALISGIIFGIIYNSTDPDDVTVIQTMKNILKKSSIVFSIAVIAGIFVPNKKDALVITGLYVGQQGVEKVMEEAGEFMPQIKEILKKELSELTENKESK